MEKQKDYTNLYTSCVTNFGSNWNNSSNAGTFQLNVNNSTSNSNSNITAHLKFSITGKPVFIYAGKLLPRLLPKYKKSQYCIGKR